MTSIKTTSKLITIPEAATLIYPERSAGSYKNNHWVMLHLVRKIQALHPDKQILVATAPHNPIRKGYMVNVSELQKALPSIFEAHPGIEKRLELMQDKLNHVVKDLHDLKKSHQDTRARLRQAEDKIQSLSIPPNQATKPQPNRGPNVKKPAE